jgi:hypothetical protein
MKIQETNMESHFFITYVVVDPATQETDFITEDRYIAEHHYGKGYTVYEKHMAVTQHTPFNRTQTLAELLWHDVDEDANLETEEIQNANDATRKNNTIAH